MHVFPHNDPVGEALRLANVLNTRVRKRAAQERDFLQIRKRIVGDKSPFPMQMPLIFAPPHASADAATFNGRFRRFSAAHMPLPSS